MATLFLTKPAEELPSRRRDPFGFAEIASYYADLLAPGITNRNRDARWLTILCWSLAQVEEDFGNKSTGDYYNYLRGLELRWIIEACQLEDKGQGRQLPGSRSVRRWLSNKKKMSLRREMGDDQWNRYRYAGPYASYRRLMQGIGLLEDDGWVLTRTGKLLARKLTPRLAEDKARRSDGNWVDYWRRRWPELSEPCANLVPRSQTSLRLSDPEIELLKPLLFADTENGERRRLIAMGLGQTKAIDHSAMCGEIQQYLLQGSNLWTDDEQKRLRAFAAFAVIADAAVAALRKSFAEVEKPTKVGDVAEMANKELSALKQVVKTWATMGIWPEVDSFVLEFKKAKNNADCLIQLVRLHQERGGGLKWLSFSKGYLDRAVRYSSPPYGFYRFRLEALARLAVGCDVIAGLPPAFQTETDEGDE